MQPVLHPHQEILVQQIRDRMSEGYRHCLLVSPVGSGKSVIIGHIVAKAHTAKKPVLILTHRKELLEQLSGHLDSFNVPHGTIRAGATTDKSHPIQIAMVQTLAARPTDSIQDPALIVIDEAHHAITDSSFGKCILRYPKAARLGVTATPRRLSGEPLSDLFDCMIIGPQTRELIDEGRLSPYRPFVPSTINTDGIKSVHGDFVRSQLEPRCTDKAIIGDALLHFQKICPKARAVVFCISIEAARKTAEQFRTAGYTTAHLDGGMDKSTREQVVNDFKSGKTQILTSCEIISEGFDLPAIECAILLRPTQSLSLFLQQCGRALRTYPGKEHAVILDHAGNIARHGFPCEEREWTLGRYETKIHKPKQSQLSVKICSQCFAAMPSTTTKCEYCGLVFPVKSRKLSQTDGELTEMDPRAARMRKVEEAKREQATRMLEQRQCQTLDDLIALGKRRGYARPDSWAKHVYQSRLNAMAKWGNRK